MISSLCMACMLAYCKAQVATGLNIANAYTELDKLSRLQGCPAFTQIEVDLMKSAVGRAKHDGQQQQGGLCSQLCFVISESHCMC